MASQGENSKDPPKGDFDVAKWFICDGCLCPWDSSVPSLAALPWIKGQPCLQQGQHKGQCPEFSFHCPWEPTESAVALTVHYNLGKILLARAGPKQACETLGS